MPRSRFASLQSAYLLLTIICCTSAATAQPPPDKPAKESTFTPTGKIPDEKLPAGNEPATARQADLILRKPKPPAKGPARPPVQATTAKQTTIAPSEKTPQPNPAVRRDAPLVVAPWPMDRVALTDGRSFRGLLESIGESSIEFAEIRRPDGKPMYLIVRPIERSQIAVIEQLGPEERKQLEERIRSFKNKALIESGQMSSVELAILQPDGTRVSRYAGQWFSLDCTADQDTTRRCIVRLEQMFLAFRQVVPPRMAAPAKSTLRFRVFASHDEYEQYLRDKKLAIRNPAYFDATANLVVAGSDIRKFSERLKQSEKQHAELLAHQQKQNDELPKLLKQLTKDLTEQDVPDKDRRRIVAAAQQKWKQQQTDLERQIKIVERKNNGLLEEVLRQMLTRLYHEAFHAYLENYVYPSRAHQVPRWLNEGLAQVFENGLIEADTLRIDAPRPASLARLQLDLSGPMPLPLAGLLAAQPTVFLARHGQETDTSARHYLYSWGVAYYLTFQRPLLGTKALDDYVASGAEQLDPQTRFERLVGMPLENFEREWRAYILSLNVPADSR